MRLEHEVVREARAAGLPVRYLVVPGAHDFDAFSIALRETFPWIASRLGSVAQVASGPASAPVRGAAA
jgi:S-formylglutathione hydrolase FrmB